MNDKNSSILRKLGNDEAFYFFTEIGNYTGQSASSLEDFLGKITEVDARSLEFHFFREDFEKWVSSAMGDARLANTIKALREQKIAKDALRDRLCLVVSRRLKELKIPSLGKTPKSKGVKERQPKQVLKKPK